MATSLDVVIPVLNEERDLPPSVSRLREFLSARMGGYQWGIVVADNGSTDSTLEIAKGMAAEDPRIGYIHLDQRGRGRAVRKAWLESSADVVAYMDVDLSTDLEYLPALVEAVSAQGYDLAIGSRLKKGAQVIGRSLKREFFSRAYSLTFRTLFLTRFQDAQCGFKAISRQAAQELLPLVQDTGWFFDTELLILAEKNGYRIKEVPVRWTDDPDTRVKVLRTAYLDLKGLLRLRFGGLRRASRALTARRHSGQV